MKHVHKVDFLEHNLVDKIFINSLLEDNPHVLNNIKHTYQHESLEREEGCYQQIHRV